MNDLLALAPNKAIMDRRVQTLEDQLDQMARLNLNLNNHYSLPEKAILIEMEKLRLSEDLALIPMFLQMKIAVQVRLLHSQHPQKLSLRELIETETRLSYSEFMFLLNVHDYLMPWLDEQGIDAVQFFQDAKKSNLKEVMPLIRSIREQRESGSDAVNNTLENMREAVLDVMPNATDEEVNNALIHELLDATQMSNSMLREKLRSEETPPIQFAIARRNGVSYLVAEVTEDQLDLLRKLNSKKQHIQINPVDDLSNTGIVKRMLRT